MNHLGTFTRTIVVAIALGVPTTLAAGPGGDGNPTTMDGTVKVILPQQGMIQMDDGTQIRVPDPQKLQGVKAGDRVRLTYEELHGRNVLIFIAPAKE